MFDVYLITGEHSASELLDKATAALRDLPRDRVGLQLRAKHLPRHERTQLAKALRELTHQHGALLLINSDLSLAQSVGADGVQLPEQVSIQEARHVLGPHALIGASRHDSAGLLAASQHGASFATLSPVFHVPGKGALLGVSGFAEAASGCALPLFALGGVTAARTSDLVCKGAHGVAVIREVWESNHPGEALRALLDAVDLGRGRREMGT